MDHVTLVPVWPTWLLSFSQYLQKETPHTRGSTPKTFLLLQNTHVHELWVEFVSNSQSYLDVPDIPHRAQLCLGNADMARMVWRCLQRAPGVCLCSSRAAHLITALMGSAFLLFFVFRFCFNPAVSARSWCPCEEQEQRPGSNATDFLSRVPLLR